MANQSTTILTKCTVELETDIFCHGCTVEWKIYDFENQGPLVSKDIKPPGCDFSWQLYFTLNESKLMRVGVKLSDEKKGVLDFYNVVHITLQNTSGDVFYNENLERPSYPESFQMGRPSCKRSLLIPKSNGEQFRLCRDDVLVVKFVILSKGCCIKNKDEKYIILEDQ